jgi:hypothetical protein
MKEWLRIIGALVLWLSAAAFLLYAAWHAWMTLIARLATT